jgi:CheY-like chemotaxis protein
MPSDQTISRDFAATGNGHVEKTMAESYILLIEDNPDDAFLASRIIGKVCEDKIIVARDGEEANKLLQRMAEDASYLQIRLVLLDLKLPKINGIAVLQSIRSNSVLRGLPVAVLTSSDNDTDQEKCTELGVLDYIFKPMTADRLQRVLSREKDA